MVIVLARVFHLSNTLNPGYMLKRCAESRSKPVEVSSATFCSVLCKLICNTHWTPYYCMQRFISEITSCKRTVLLTTDSCIQQGFSSQTRCRLCPIWPIKAGNKLLCTHSVLHYCSLVAWLVSAQHWGSEADVFCGWLSWNIWKKVAEQPYLMGEGREHGSMMHIARS